MLALHHVLDEVKLRGMDACAIGFSAAMHGVVAVDARGEPISPLINWMDRRSATIAEGWRRDGTAAELYARTGAPMHPMLPLCKLRWMAEHDGERFKRAARFVGMKELFAHRWTGEWMIDYALGTATGMMDTRTGAWDPQALDLAGVTPERLSMPSPCATRLTVSRGTVAKTLGIDAATEIVLASSDGALANLGTGAVTPDVMALTLGTSGAVRVVGERPLLDADGRTFCYRFDDRSWLIGGPTSSAGAVLQHVSSLVFGDVPPERRFEHATALAAEVAPGADGLTILPFLSGERAPHWRGDLRGLFAGLDLAHDHRHVMRAAFEGMVFALHSVARVMRDLGIAPKALLLSGGLTHAPFVRQLIADVFEMDARVPDRGEASAFGAAMFAALATGAIGSLDAVRALVSYPQTHVPEADNRAAYRAAFQRFEARCRNELEMLDSAQVPSSNADYQSAAGRI